MNNNAKTIIALEAILAGILVASLVFLVVSYDLSTGGELPQMPNSETTCGEGTIEIDGICYGDIEIKTLQDKVEFLESTLAKKAQEYEWLSEITESLRNGQIEDIPVIINDDPPQI